MTTLKAAEARQEFFGLLENVARGHRVYRITHDDGDAVLLSYEDYDRLIETLALLSTPGVASSIRRARREIARGGTSSFEDVFGPASARLEVLRGSPRSPDQPCPTSCHLAPSL